MGRVVPSGWLALSRRGEPRLDIGLNEASVCLFCPWSAVRRGPSEPGIDIIPGSNPRGHDR